MENRRNEFKFWQRSVLLEETNITQAPGQDTRWAPHSGRESSTRGTGTETGVGGGVGSGVLAWEGGRGRCATSEEVRLDQWAGAGGYLAVAGLLSFFTVFFTACFSPRAFRVGFSLVSRILTFYFVCRLFHRTRVSDFFLCESSWFHVCHGNLLRLSFVTFLLQSLG